MSSIVCAIRGGPESKATLDKARELAKEKDLPIDLLYVVNLDFLSQVTGGHVQTASEEVHSMGDFILAVAKEELEAAGVKVYTHVRHGVVHEELIALINEREADYVVVGERRPTVDVPEDHHSVVRRFGHVIHEQTGVQVVIVEQSDD